MKKFSMRRACAFSACFQSDAAESGGGDAEWSVRKGFTVQRPSLALCVRLGF